MNAASMRRSCSIAVQPPARREPRRERWIFETRGIPIVRYVYGITSALLAGGTALALVTQSPVGAQVAQNEKSEIAKVVRSEEHTSELQSIMRNSDAVLCLKKNSTQKQHTQNKVTTNKRNQR